MMISPDGYYEEFLKGRSKEEILRTIRGLKKEFGRLKNISEERGYDLDLNINPNIKTQISMTREYLATAKQAYIEAGGVYKLSRAELKSVDFDSNIDFISKITFGIGGFFGGSREYVVYLKDGFNAFSKGWDDEVPLIVLDEDDEPFTRDTFIAALKNLHIGEWRSFYSTERFGYVVCDGTQWEIEFEYSNGHRPVKYSGDNSYPYNFDEFELLFGISDTMEDDDE